MSEYTSLTISRTCAIEALDKLRHTDYRSNDQLASELDAYLKEQTLCKFIVTSKEHSAEDFVLKKMVDI